jgi:hypothetical protein
MSFRQSNLLRLLQLVRQEALVPQGEMVRPLLKLLLCDINFCCCVLTG